MDAVGLASSIISFIEVAHKIVSGSYEIYKSSTGATKDHDHTSRVLGDLDQVAKALQQREETSNDEQLLILSEGCLELSKNLKKLLNKSLPKGPGPWHAFRAACQSLRKQDEAAAMENRLDRYRQQISQRLILLLLEKQSPIKKDLDDIRRHGLELSNAHARHIEDLEHQLSKTLRFFQKDDLQSERSHASGGPPTTDEKLSELAHQTRCLSSLLQNMPEENRVLRRLFFPSIFRRENDVVDAAGETFAWIFDGEQEPAAAVDVQLSPNQEPDEVARRRDTSRSFIRFLREGDGRTFFVTGKAGCGKSTFMKYIAHHAKSEAYLGSWVRGAKLAIIRVFFWQSDDPFQASIEGFWRSILFQLLSQCPELIPKVFPQAQPPGVGAVTDAVEFRASELEAAFSKLIQLSYPENYRYVFFIDGLDEHEGDNDTHARLANLLVTRASLANVKIVCSSRPHTVFLDAFGNGCVVRFHELTRSDIASFARTRFEASLVGDQMLLARRNCAGLVDDITSRAQGVFLWASIVVRALINQALDHDREEESLRRRLEECPDDLDALFEQMLSRVNNASHIRRKSNVALYLAVHNPFESPLNMLVYSWLDGLGWCQNVDTLQDADHRGIGQSQYSEADIASCRERVEVLLHQVTQGLLEIVTTDDRTPFFKHRVDMYHRSARDFLKDQWRLGRRSNPFSSTSEEVDIYCRLRSLEAKAVAMQGGSLQMGDVDQGDENILRNLRVLFDYTFFWLAACATEGNHASSSSVREFESALQTAERTFRPFLLGLMLIDEEVSWRYYTRKALQKCSFLHFAAYYGQENLIRQTVDLDVRKASPRPSDLNLLFSSSVGADVRTTDHLLATRHQPHEMISILDHDPGHDSFARDVSVEISAAQVTWQSIPDIGHGKVGRQGASGEQPALVSIWLVFLRDLANNVRMYLWKRAVSSSYPYHLNREWLGRLACIVEAYLRAGADSSVYFILLVGSTPRRIDLYQMLDIFQPENLASIAELLSKRRRSLRELLDATVSLLWRSQLASLEEVTTSDLRNHAWRVLGVRSECCGELMGSFKVRVF